MHILVLNPFSFRCETYLQKFLSTHHRDKPIAGPALHQVGDIDEDRCGDAGSTHEFTWTSAHLMVNKCEADYTPEDFFNSNKYQKNNTFPVW